MDPRSRYVEKLEQILSKLIEIDASSPGVQPQQFRAWLDLAITEARSQLEKVKMETVH